MLLERLSEEIHSILRKYPLAEEYFRRVEEDNEIKELQELSNVTTVERLNYNDHGRVHAYIVTHNALKIMEILKEKGIVMNTVKEGVGTEDDAALIVVLGAFLHDIGNAVHRHHHGIHSMILASPILDRLLHDHPRRLLIKVGVLEAIYSHNDDVPITLEAGIVKVADGTDMAEGRARIPYKRGSFSIHSLSALSIKRVEILPGKERPLRIEVEMEHTAGVFQVEMVLGDKIKRSSLKGMVEVVVKIPSIGEKLMYF